jgi:hypothetical protein
VTGLTEMDLIKAGVGKFRASRMPGYDEKKAFYTQEGLWKEFCRLRQMYRDKLTHPVTGYVENDKASEMAQVEIDAILFRRVRGQEVSAAVIADKSDEMLRPAEEFVKTAETTMFPSEKKEAVDTLDIIRWIYDNIGVKDVRPSDAPTPGAYQHLMTVRNDGDALTDFYKTIWPKTFTKDDGKDAKYNDDGRAVIELIRRLQKQNAGAAAV